MANNKFDIKVFTDELNKAFTILKKEQVLEKYMKNVLLNYNSIIYIGNITDEPNKYNTIYNYMYGEDNTLCNIVIFETEGSVDSESEIIPSGIHIAYPYLDYDVCIDYEYILNINNSAELLTPTQEYKTINNESILGSGNIAVQEPLVSGTNIKTINNKSILGAGNIDISGDRKRISFGTLTDEGTLDLFKFQELDDLYYNGDLIQVQFEYNNITYITASAYSNNSSSLVIVAYDVSNSLNVINLSINTTNASYTITPIEISGGDNKLPQLVDGSLTTITAEDLAGATEVRDYAFDHSNITNITLPNSVTSIGAAAFNFCLALTQITIPNSVTSIGESAFNRCIALTQITIPNGVTMINTSTFSYCEALTQITIPNGVTSIGSSAFYSCTALTELTIPANVTSISYNALHIGTTTKKATITMKPTTPPKITSNTFNTDKLIKIIVPVGCGNTYKSATNWSKFADYIEEATA